MVTNKLNTSFVSGLSLDFDIFAVLYGIEGELSGIEEAFGRFFFLFEQAAAMLKR